MLDKIVSLLEPDVSTEAKLNAVSITIGKAVDRFESRLDTIEIKTLIPIERGERGRDGKDGQVDYKKVNQFLNNALSDKYALEAEDFNKLMDITWEKW